MGLEEDWQAVSPDALHSIAWLRELQEKLWPPEQAKKGQLQTRRGSFQLALDAKRELSETEWTRVRQAIVEHKLVIEMIGTSMFGGVGIRLWEHPPLPGLDDADHVLTLTEDHVFGESEPDGRGNCLQEAYDLFYEMANTEDNQRWCKQYNLAPPKDMYSYCY